jgi:hypothetical protein
MLVASSQVRPVKVLGVLCMIDEGEADWKVIAIDRDVSLLCLGPMMYRYWTQWSQSGVFQ